MGLGRDNDGHWPCEAGGPSAGAAPGRNRGRCAGSGNGGARRAAGPGRGTGAAAPGSEDEEAKPGEEEEEEVWEDGDSGHQRLGKAQVQGGESKQDVNQRWCFRKAPPAWEGAFGSRHVPSAQEQQDLCCSQAEKSCQGIKQELPLVKTFPVPRWVCTHTRLHSCWNPSHSPQINGPFKVSQPDQDNFLPLDMENQFLIVTAPAPESSEAETKTWNLLRWKEPKRVVVEKEN